MIIKLLGWILIIAPFVVADWYLIERRKQDINHGVEFVFRGMAAILYGIFVFDTQVGMMGVHVLSFEALSFWLLFEPSLNIARGLAWDYLGTTAASDRFFRKNRGLYYILKVIALGVVIYNIIYLIRL